MIPLNEFKVQQNKYPTPITIEPEIAGAWAWPDPFTAEFTPENKYVASFPSEF
jgi:hypothetical protein